jgi:hypothetical protein
LNARHFDIDHVDICQLFDTPWICSTILTWTEVIRFNWLELQSYSIAEWLSRGILNFVSNSRRFTRLLILYLRSLTIKTTHFFKRCNGHYDSDDTFKK